MIIIHPKDVILAAMFGIPWWRTGGVAYSLKYKPVHGGYCER